MNFCGIKIEISLYCHDHDNKSKKIIEKHFPESIEIYDLGHKCKNLVKLCEKNFVRSEKKWGRKIANAFACSIKFSDGDEKKIEKKLEAFFFHWTGNHKFCDENCEKKIYIYFKKDSELGKKIKTIINSLKQSSGKYAKMIRTNINESFHNVITTITPKRKDFRTSYNSKTKLATLYFNDGFEEIKGIFKELNLKINENFNIWN